MSTTFNDEEAYALFLILDSLARIRKGEDQTVMHMRERLLPVYRDWHKSHPFMVHPDFTPGREPLPESKVAALKANYQRTHGT